MKRRPVLIPYIGGKYYLARKIVDCISHFYPHHETYVEVFGGGLNVFLAKDPSPQEIVNDIDDLLVNLYRVMKDPNAFRKFIRMVQFTLYSRSEYNYAQRKIREFRNSGKRLDPDRPDPFMAWCFYASMRMSMSGQEGTGWGFVVSARRRKSALSRFVHDLRKIHNRFVRVQIEHDDFRVIIPRYDSSQTLFYLDPPYVKETRRTSKAYHHEMSLEDHMDLVELLLGIQGGAILSCYFHEVYQPLLDRGWIRIDMDVPIHSVVRNRMSGLVGDGALIGGGYLAIETLIIKPPQAQPQSNPNPLSKGWKMRTLFDMSSLD